LQRCCKILLLLLPSSICRTSPLALTNSYLSCPFPASVVTTSAGKDKAFATCANGKRPDLSYHHLVAMLAYSVSECSEAQGVMVRAVSRRRTFALNVGVQLKITLLYMQSTSLLLVLHLIQKLRLCSHHLASLGSLCAHRSVHMQEDAHLVERCGIQHQGSRYNERGANKHTCFASRSRSRSAAVLSVPGLSSICAKNTHRAHSTWAHTPSPMLSSSGSNNEPRQGSVPSSTTTVDENVCALYSVHR
jgi:uncharacterized protein YcgI (DUF1989 family)